MTKPFSRAAVATSLNRAVVAWITTGLLALALLLAPHSGHGAVPSTDADVLGKWISDKNDPAMDYAVAPGPAKGTYRLMVPAKAIGRAEGETVILQQTGPGEFATVKARMTHSASGGRESSVHHRTRVRRKLSRDKPVTRGTLVVWSPRSPDFLHR